MGRDPIGYQTGDPNLYRFVGGRPGNATDPSGLEFEYAYDLEDTPRDTAPSDQLLFDQWVWEAYLNDYYASKLSGRTDAVGAGGSMLGYFWDTYYNDLTGGWYGSGVSALSDFVPGLGGIKGGQEAVTGFDVARGEESGTGDRVIAGMGLLPGGKWLGKGGRWVLKKVRARAAVYGGGSGATATTLLRMLTM